MLDLTTRHPSTQQIMRYFAYAHLPAHLATISGPCCALAEAMVLALPDSAELTVGLRKLLESKDAFVRAALS